MRMVRSAAYRIAIIYSMIFIGAAAVLGVGIYWAAHVALRAQLDDRIASETSSLVSEYRGEGSASLRVVIARREAAHATRDLGYALFATDGRRVAGRLATSRPMAAGWQSILFQDPVEGIDEARAQVIDLSDGERLLVAADWDELGDTDRLILTLLGVVLLVMLFIGAVGALILGAYLRRRLSTISRTAENILAGDLGSRASIGAHDDEFDRLAIAINAMLDRIGSLLDNLRQVSGDLAHDLRTPLTRLRNQLEEGLQAGGGSAVIEQAIEQSDEVLALFTAILRLSEIEAGKLRDAFMAVDITSLVTEIGDSYAPAIEDGGRLLVCRINDVPTIRGDRELIAQAIINLLDNAQLHTPVGITITVSLAASATGVTVSVDDDGPGVAEADRARITQRFTRLEASRTRPGHGLGLSLVAAIVEMHGARMTIADHAPGLFVALTFPR